MTSILGRVAKTQLGVPIGRQIIDELDMLGVDTFTESGPVIKFMLKTEANSMFSVKREMLRRVKIRFDELGIGLPVPHRRILDRISATDE